MNGRYEYERDAAEIYRRSFAIIRREAELSRFSPVEERIAVRLVHTSGSVELAADIAFSPTFADVARAALRAGAPIYCDANMIVSGVTRARLPANNRVRCLLDDPRVPALARELRTTRSAAAISLLAHPECLPEADPERESTSFPGYRPEAGPDAVPGGASPAATVSPSAPTAEHARERLNRTSERPASSRPRPATAAGSTPEHATSERRPPTDIAPERRGPERSVQSPELHPPELHPPELHAQEPVVRSPEHRMPAFDSASRAAELPAPTDRAPPLLDGAVIAIGNAPTALYRLLELLDETRARPAAVIGVPVGFVGAAESKAALELEARVPWLVVRGRRGGSALAVAAINAIASDEE